MKSKFNHITKIPLNSLQKGMLFYSIHEEYKNYINQVIISLEETVNPSTLEEAIMAFVKSHDILTANVDLKTFELIIPKKERYSVEFLDFSYLSQDLKKQELKKI